MLLGVPQVHGAAGHVQQHHRCAHIHHCFYQLPLGLWQQQVYLIAGGILIAGVVFLALQRLVQTHAEDDNVAVLGHIDRLADSVVVPGKALHLVFPQVAALGVVNPDTLRYRVLNALQHGDIPGGGAVIISYQRRTAVGVGPYDPDGLQLAFV